MKGHTDFLLSLARASRKCIFCTGKWSNAGVFKIQFEQQKCQDRSEKSDWNCISNQLQMWFESDLKSDFMFFFFAFQTFKNPFWIKSGHAKKKDFCLQSKRSLICIEKRCVWKEWHRLYLNMTATVLHQSLFWSLSHVMWGYLQEWQMNSTTKLTHGKYQLVTTSFI